MKRLIFIFGVASFLSTSTVAAPLNLAADVYIARFNATADQMDSGLNLDSKNTKIQSGEKFDTAVFQAAPSVGVILAMKKRTDVLTSVTATFAGDGKIQAVADSVAGMVLVPMAAFHRPKKAGVGKLAAKLCSDATKQEGKLQRGKIGEVEIGCISMPGAIILTVGD